MSFLPSTSVLAVLAGVLLIPHAGHAETSGVAEAESLRLVWDIPMAKVDGEYVEFEGWVGREEFGSVMAFWKAESRTSGVFALMNYPEDLSEVSLRYKYIRTAATRFEVDCENHRLHAVEQVRTTAPFMRGEKLKSMPIMRKWIHITHQEGEIHHDQMDNDRDHEIYERTFRMACSMPKSQ